jgi:hypothetical protein
VKHRSWPDEDDVDDHCHGHHATSDDKRSRGSARRERERHREPVDQEEDARDRSASQNEDKRLSGSSHALVKKQVTHGDRQESRSDDRKTKKHVRKEKRDSPSRSESSR